MITKNRMWFFEEPTDGGGGGGEKSKGAAALEPEVQPTGAPPTSEASHEPPPPPTVDAGELAEKFGAVLSEKFKTPVTEEKKVDQLSPEEAKKLLNVFDITPDWVARFDNLETRSAAIGELRDGFIKHSDTITQYRLREMIKSLEEKYNPVLKFMDDYQNERATERFNKKYEQLADSALQPVVEAVTEKLVKAGTKFKTEDEWFEAIASGVEKVIQVSNKDFKLTAGSNPATAKTKGQPTSAIPVTTPGSGGGTATKGSTPAKPRALAIWDK